MSLRLLTFLQLSALIVGIGDLYTQTEKKVGALCYIQALQIQFFDWCIFMWSLMIAIAVFLVIVLEYRGKRYKFEIISHIVVLFFAILFTGLPFIGMTYGNAGNWTFCWIDPTVKLNDFPIGSFWVWTTMYGPVWLICIIITILITISIIKIWRLSKTIVRTGNEHKYTRTYIKLSLYPIIFVLVWTFPTIDAIYVAIVGKKLFVLDILRSISVPLQGFLNGLAFLIFPASDFVQKWRNNIFQKIKTWICCASSQKKTKKEIANIDLQEDFISSKEIKV